MSPRKSPKEKPRRLKRGCLVSLWLVLGKQLCVMAVNPLACRFLYGGENLASCCGMICRDCPAFQIFRDGECARFCHGINHGLYMIIWQNSRDGFFEWLDFGSHVFGVYCFRVCVVHSLACLHSIYHANIIPSWAFLLNHADPANPAHLRQNLPVY